MTTKIREILENGPGLFITKISTENLSVENFAEFQILCSSIGQLKPQNKNRDLIGVIRKEKAECRLSQPFHIDGAKYLALCCVQPARVGGEFRIISSEKIVASLAQNHTKELNTLQEAWPFWRKGRIGPSVFYRKIVSFEEDDFRLFYLPNTLRETPVKTGEKFNADQLQALDTLDTIIQQEEFVFSRQLQFGEVLFLNNHKFLHSRNAYNDDEKERIMLRAWID